jgi:glutamate racemase
MASDNPNDPRPIGVFDSGIGGLTVLRELILRFPHESFTYLGDTARLPYGTKSPQTIRKYSEQNLDFLCRQDVKSLVVACSSASTQIHESEFQGRRIYTVIIPSAKKALRESATQRIGVLGTRATVASQAYPQAIKKINPAAQVFSVACPLFVPLAEEGWGEDPLTNLVAYRYLKEISAQDIDTLILGCTHYPLLSPAIKKVMGPNVTLVESGAAVADQMEPELILAPRVSDETLQSLRVKIFVTDESDQFRDLAQRILGPSKINSFELISL